MYIKRINKFITVCIYHITNPCSSKTYNNLAKSTLHLSSGVLGRQSVVGNDGGHCENLGEGECRAGTRQHKLSITLEASCGLVHFVGEHAEDGAQGAPHDLLGLGVHAVQAGDDGSLRDIPFPPLCALFLAR